MAEAIRAGRARRVLLARGARSTRALRALLAEAEAAGLEPEVVDPAAIDALGLVDHQGAAALVRLPSELDERGLRSFPFPGDALVVALDGITDPQNFGACARAAEAAGATLLLTRERRAAPLSPAAVRASAGALLHLPVARVTNLRRALDELRDRGFVVVGLDHRAGRTVYDPPPRGRPLVLVVGAEDVGLSRLVREGCEELVAIPMAGRTESLNASAALAVALFAYARRPG
ncbi:MAG TPA: RNA methyltransferase [Actinomycetota bacterium]|nr:RNA methyltransferase [Actinomycetota bacterium]